MQLTYFKKDIWTVRYCTKRIIFQSCVKKKGSSVNWKKKINKKTFWLLGWKKGLLLFFWNEFNSKKKVILNASQRQNWLMWEKNLQQSRYLALEPAIEGRRGVICFLCGQLIDYEGPIVAYGKAAHELLQRIKYQSIDRSIEFVLAAGKGNQTRRCTAWLPPGACWM